MFRVIVYSALKRAAHASVCNRANVVVNRMSSDIAVIFDLDGTLIDFEVISEEVLNDVLSATPNLASTQRVTRAHHNSIIGMKKSDWSAKLLADLDVHESVLSPTDFAQKWTERLVERHAHIRPMPGAGILIEQLKEANIPMAIATSSDAAQCESKLSYHPDIRDAMRVIVTGDEVTNGKPAPDIFLLTAKKLGVAPENCIVVEDSLHGVEAAIAAGMIAVAVLDERFGGSDPLITSRLPSNAVRADSLLGVWSVVQAKMAVNAA